MRKHIDLFEQSALEEARLGHVMAAAALAGTMGYHLGNADEPKAPADPQIIITGMNDGDPIDQVGGETTAPKKKLSKREESIRLLALTIWGEARSDGPAAMRAVAHVIMNRMHSERNFGNTIKEVVWKRKHFSCWNAGDPNREAMKRIPKLSDNHPSKQRWKEALVIARNVVDGKDRVDPTRDALFYHTKSMGMPYWVTPDIKPVARIGGHLFYKTDAKAEDKA